MKICMQCQTEYEDKFTFCPQCGQKLEDLVEELKCPNCGCALKENMNFCPECGAKAKNDHNSQNIDIQENTQLNNEDKPITNIDYEKLKTTNDETDNNIFLALLSKNQWAFVVVITVLSWISKKGNAISAARRGYNIGSFNVIIAALAEGVGFAYIMVIYNLVIKEYKNKNSKKMIMYIIAGVFGFCVWAVIRKMLFDSMGIR